MWQTVPLWPVRASTIAPRVDALMIFLLTICGIMAVMIFVLVFVFAIRFRHKAHPHAEQIEGSHALEATWTLIPLCVFMVFFVWGASIYMAEAQPPKGAMEIYAVPKQWMWKFEHQTGQREINTLHVPVGRDVRLTMISQDVIHSFFVPAFRIKQDVLPGRYTTTWFRATKAGSYHLFCAEYCGTQHSGMIGYIEAMEPVDYQAWLAGGATGGSLASSGQQLFTELGCVTCHRSDTQGRGPNLVGIYGKPVTLDDGRTVIADEGYVRESILSPGTKVVAGYKLIMPTFQGLVSEEQLLSLIAYVKSLSQPAQQSSGGGQQVSQEQAAPGEQKVQ